MEELLLKMLRHIKEEIPELSYIDEDTGQLETNEDTYPVTFPCVLIGNTQINWKDLGVSGSQKGDGSIIVRLAIDCYSDTHIGSTQEEGITERQRFAKRIFKALQCEVLCESISPLSRIKSRDYTLPGNIQVYEQMYQFDIHEEMD